jgi:Secretion system C-terminal sorting domain/Pregnancy-associated plasma protein-A
MKHFLSVLLSLMTMASLAQTQCRSFEYRQQQLKVNPTLTQTVAAIEQFTSRQLSQHPVAVTGGTSGAASGTSSGASSGSLPSLITIPVVVHILYNTNAENISDAQVQSQIDVLNADYQKQNADTAEIPAYYRSLAANCGFRFGLALADTNGQSTTGIIHKYTNNSYFTIDDDIKSAATGGDDGWDRDRYLNIWVGNLTGDVLGYSSVVGGAKATDGVVVLYTAFGTTGKATAPFNLGRTAVHEVGHWLNMIHTWGDDSCGTDLVADTPPQQGPTYGDPSGIIVSCGNTPYGNLYQDYMDFTDDIGMHLFTNGQKARMLTLFAPGGFRYALLSDTVPVDTATAAVTAAAAEGSVYGMTIYPNPAVSLVTIQLTDPACLGGLLDVYNQLGQKVMTVRMTGLTLQLDVAGLASGIYFIRASDGKKGAVGKLMKL